MARERSSPGRLALLIGLPLLLAASTFYFYARTFTGEYGTLARDRIVVRHASAQRELDRLENILAQKKRRNRGLRPESVDLDLLDERARAELGMLRTDEVFLLEE